MIMRIQNEIKHKNLTQYQKENKKRGGRFKIS